jgi:hypothetical protein
MRNLNRFVQGAPGVRTATRGDLTEVTMLTLADCAESGRRLPQDGPERVARLALQALEDECARVLVAVRGRQTVGMVWCARRPPDAWDDRAVMTVDWLYVVPEERRRPATVLALLRATARVAAAWRVPLVRFTAEDANPRLARQYERILGARKEWSFVTLAREVEV